jgi:hypothetical protein
MEPKLVAKSINLKISQSISKFEFIPYMHCQNIPVIITNTSVTDFDKEYLSYNETHIIINSNNFEANVTYNIDVYAKTNTTIPIEMYDSISIVFVNELPEISNIEDEYIVSKTLGFYEMFPIFDNENDKVYVNITSEIDNIQTSISDSVLSIEWNTTDISIGNYIIDLILWDQFHILNPLSTKFTIVITENLPPYFVTNLPASLIVYQ